MARSASGAGGVWAVAARASGARRVTPSPSPPQNPLLAGATVNDLSAPAGGDDTRASSATAAAAEGEGMGAELSTQLPAPTRHGRLAGAPRRAKVPFEKGYSQMDWVRLTQTHKDLAGLGGGRPRRDITLEEVALHCTREDAWTVLRGKVGQGAAARCLRRRGRKRHSVALGLPSALRFAWRSRPAAPPTSPPPPPATSRCTTSPPTSSSTLAESPSS